MPQSGAPRLLRKIAFMEGDWNVVMHVRPDLRGEWMETTGISSFRFVLDGCVLEQVYEGVISGSPFRGKGFFAFNRFSGKWQHVWSDNVAANINIFEGDFVEGKLVVSGKEKSSGGEILARATTFNISENAFEWMLESSVDGEAWTAILKAAYSRKKI